MTRKSTVPTPENKRVVAGGKPVSTGTRKVAPNIATTCCAPMPKVRGQLSRSSGATTYASDGTGLQVILPLAGLTVLDYTPSPGFSRVIHRCLGRGLSSNQWSEQEVFHRTLGAMSSTTHCA